jgi:tRNA(Ile2) C34 agmatinyltransferase TiaS
MIKLTDILNEIKQTIEEFASTRLKGAEKIADTTQKKGGLSLLTYKHYKVKLPYYKKAVAGKLDKEEAKKEFKETYKKISLDMTQTEFQIEMGRLEVLGELLIENK